MTSQSACFKKASRTWSPRLPRPINPNRTRSLAPRTRSAANAVVAPARKRLFVNLRRVHAFEVFMCLRFVDGRRAGSSGVLLGVRHLIVMVPEQILTKIVLQIAPDTMNVIGVILSVVVFHQERRTLNAIVMALARLEPSRPGKGNFVRTCLLDFFQIGCRDLGPIAKEIFLEQAKKQFALLIVKMRGGDTQRIERPSLSFGAGDDIARSKIGDKRHLKLIRVHRFYQLRGEILFTAQHTQALAWPALDFCRISAKEGGSNSQDLLARHCEIQGEMMSFHSPAPGAVARCAEDREEIKIGVAVRRFVFEVIKDLLETHDGGGFHIAALAQSGAEQRMSEQALGRVHILYGKAFARFRNEMPIKPLRVFEFKNSLGPQFRCESGQEIVGCLAHLLGR